MVQLTSSVVMLEFSPLNERVIPCGCELLGEGSHCCLYLCTQQQLGIPSLLEFLGGVLEGTSCGDFMVFLDDLNAYMGDNGQTWRELIGLYEC